MLPVSGKDLVKLIPQKEPFVLVSTLHDVTDNACHTSFDFDEQHVLCNNGFLSLAGLLENMAQSSGCKLGYEDFMDGVAPRRGFIGEMKDLVFYRFPKAGSLLSTEVIVEGKVFGAVTIVHVKVADAQGELASCRMKIFFQ